MTSVARAEPSGRARPPDPGVLHGQRRRRPGIRMLVTWLTDAAALMLLSAVLASVTVDSFEAALLASALIGLVNALRVAAGHPARAADHGADARARRRWCSTALVVLAVAAASTTGCTSTSLGDGVVVALVLTVGHHGRRRRCSRSTTTTVLDRNVVAPAGAARQGAVDDRRARAAVPRDRRPRPRRPAPRDARRQRADDGRAGCATARTGCTAGRPTGPRRPAPARRGCCTATTTTCPRSAGGRRTAARAIVTNHPQGRDGARAPPLRRPRAAVRGRREPREHPLRRRAAQPADDEHGARPRPPGADRPGLLRLLREPLQRHAHGLRSSIARDRRASAAQRRAAAAPRRPAADPPRLRLRDHARLGDGDPARPAGRRPSSPTCTPAGRSIYTTFLAYDEVAHHSGVERPDTLPTLRRVDRADRADRRARPRTRRARTGSSCCPTTASRRARRSCDRYGESPRGARRATPRDADATPRRRPGRRGASATSAPRLTEASAATRHGRAARRREAPTGDGAVELTSAGRSDGRAASELPELVVMASGCLGPHLVPARAGPRHARALEERLPGACSPRCATTRASASCSCAPSARRGRDRRARHALPRRGPGRGRGPARAVRPERRRARPAHRRLPALPRHRRQQHLLGRPRRGRRVRGARRLARRDGRRAVVPVRPAPRDLPSCRRRSSSAPRRCTGCSAAGSCSSATPSYGEEPPGP